MALFKQLRHSPDRFSSWHAGRGSNRPGPPLKAARRAKRSPHSTASPSPAAAAAACRRSSRLSSANWTSCATGRSCWRRSRHEPVPDRNRKILDGGLAPAVDEQDVADPVGVSSSTTYCTIGLRPTGSISFGWDLVAGSSRVPSPDDRNHSASDHTPNIADRQPLAPGIKSPGLHEVLAGIAKSARAPPARRGRIGDLRDSVLRVVYSISIVTGPSIR